MLGILAYPTLWVWDGTRKDLLNVRFQRNPRQCVNAILGGSNLHIFEDGYVAIDSSDRIGATRNVNALFLSFSLLEGQILEPVTERSLEVLDIAPSGTRLPRTWSMLQMGNVINMYEDARKELESRGYLTVGSDEFLVVLELAEKLLGSAKPGSIYRMLEVLYLVSIGQWTGSFVLGWITVEEAIDAELSIHYAQQGMSHIDAEAAVRRLKEWQVISELKALSPIALSPPDPTPFDVTLLEEFDKLRDLRNTIVHEGVPATEGDARRMKAAAWRAMWRLMRHRALNYNDFLDRIGPLQAANKSRLDPP